MNINYELTLSDDKNWIKTSRPVKLIHLKLSPIDNRFKVKRIYVFIGDPEVKKIINNNKKLENRFGKNWREILHKGGYIKTDGGELIDIGDDAEEEITKKKSSIPKTMDSLVKYIYDYGIFMDDSIETIKNKIEIETGVSPINQHIFWSTKKDVYKPFDYYIKYITQLDTNYPINILDLFKNVNKKMLNLPLDTNFMKEYNNRNLNIISYLYYTYYSVIYENFKYNEKNYKLNSDLPFTLYLVDIDSINDYIDKNKYERINMTEYSRFYTGLILKYWPSISSKNKNIFVTKSSKDLTKAKNNYIYENKIKNWISDVNKSDILKYFEPNLIIEMMQIKANYDVDLYLDKELIDIRILYEYLEPNEFIREIKYGGKIKRYGLTKEKESESLRLELNTIYFRLDIGDDKMPMKFELHRKGHMNIESYGRQIFKTTFHQFVENMLETSNKLINKINALGNIVLIGGFKLPILSYYNISVKFMNTPVYFKLKNPSIDELDLIYIDPIKFPALINIMKGYFKPNHYIFNEPSEGMIHSMKVSLIRIPEYKILAKKKIINQMNPNTKVIKENKITIRFLYEGELFKISMHGVRDVSVYHYAFNFLSRILYLYREYNANKIKDNIINKLLEKSENAFMIKHKQYLKYSIPYSKLKKKDIITAENVYKYLNEKKPIKEIKLLKDTDNILFNYDHLFKSESGKKLKPYSKVCQSGMQPIPMTKESLEKWNKYKKNPNIPVLKYSNKTKPNKDIYYVCPYRVYKYPGFQRYDKHPKGYCLPCCRKKDFLNNPESMAYRRYMECMKIGQIPSNVKRRQIEQKMYIKNYGKAGQNRYSWLPEKLMIIFNEHWYNIKTKEKFTNKCAYRKIRQLDTQLSNCVLLRGIKQSYKSYVTAIELALNIEHDELLTVLIKKLEKNKYIFNNLEMGMIKTRFESINNYIKFLESDDNFINESTVENLIEIFNPIFPNKLNIIIFNVIEKDIKLKSKHDNIYLSQLLSNPNYYHIVLVKDKTNYYPLYRKGNMIFTNDNIIIKIVKSIINSTITDDVRDKFELLKLNALIEKLKGLKDIYEIYSQYIMVDNNNINIVIGLCLKEIKSKKKFIIPVEPSPSTNLPLLEKYINGDYDIVKNFLDSSGIYFNYKLLINTKLEIVGFLLTSDRVILINPVKYKKEMGTRLAYRYNPNDISLTKGTRKLDYELTEQTYLNQLHHVIEIEFNNKLFTEKNKIIRNKIKNILVSNFDLNLKHIMNKIYSNFNQLGTTDLNRIKQIINLAKYHYKYDNKTQPKKIIQNLFSATTFNYDLDTVRKLKTLIQEYKIEHDDKIEKEITNILDYNLKKIIKIIRPNFNEDSNISQESTLINLCLSKNKSKCDKTKIVGRQQCYFNTDDNKCMIIMDKDNYIYHLLRLKSELIKNEAKQIDLLNIRLDTLVEKS